MRGIQWAFSFPKIHPHNEHIEGKWNYEEQNYQVIILISWMWILSKVESYSYLSWFCYSGANTTIIQSFLIQFKGTYRLAPSWVWPQVCIKVPIYMVLEYHRSNESIILNYMCKTYISSLIKEVFNINTINICPGYETV